MKSPSKWSTPPGHTHAIHVTADTRRALIRAAHAQCAEARDRGEEEPAIEAVMAARVAEGADLLAFVEAAFSLARIGDEPWRETLLRVRDERGRWGDRLAEINTAEARSDAKPENVQSTAVDAEYERARLISIMSHTKHGPEGRGGRGDCDATCIKCEAQRRLDRLNARGHGAEERP